jgi:hypothetical protein
MPKFLKPVINNGQVDSPLQFKVKHDTNIAKKVRPKQVFEYSSNNTTPRPQTRSQTRKKK